MKKVVYSIPCSDCNKVYIGETGRMRETRMNEHRAKIRSLASDSKLVEHIQQYKHKFDFSKVETLAVETGWRKRVIKESILTNKMFGNAINDTKHTLRVFG
jgi:DNA-binding sugar fermentation-stimulating protein